MKEENLKLARQDVEEALSTVESLEKEMDSCQCPKDLIKEKFMSLSEKMNKIEKLLIEEGVL